VNKICVITLDLSSFYPVQDSEHLDTFTANLLVSCQDDSPPADIR